MNNEMVKTVKKLLNQHANSFMKSDFYSFYQDVFKLGVQDPCICEAKGKNFTITFKFNNIDYTFRFNAYQAVSIFV